MTITGKLLLPVFAPLAGLGLAGCASFGSLEDILATVGAGGLYGNEVSGEISRIDTRRQEIEIASAWGGAERVRYDGRTEVIYRQRRYDVRDLERGDRVRVRVDDRRDRDRDRYATVIHVQESRTTRSDDRDVYSRPQRLDGRVTEVDARRGWFEMTDSRGDPILVTLPYDPNRTLRDRFGRVRRGDRVRIEGVWLNRSRVEVLRFL
ncbi:MAG TPA: hypothetical protein VMN39_04845 [Longimicrobiaceae bacterium]|nr:hypothetical protein [Longimicrobiaceae bacterium]